MLYDDSYTNTARYISISFTEILLNIAIISQTKHEITPKCLILPIYNMVIVMLKFHVESTELQQTTLLKLTKLTYTFGTTQSRSLLKLFLKCASQKY